MEESVFYNRDLSWLGFNGQILRIAGDIKVPILERIKFLSIYSSNLDEFHRVRIPVLMAMDQADEITEGGGNYQLALQEINRQQQRFGNIISTSLLPALMDRNVCWLYNQSIPHVISSQISEIFFNEILAHVYIKGTNLEGFFPENNKLYQAVLLKDAAGREKLELVNVPSDVIPRFYEVSHLGIKYVVFLDDIISYNIGYFFPDDEVIRSYNIKITRDADFKVDYDSEEEIEIVLERQLENRDFGLATRFLCEPGMQMRHLYHLIYTFKLQNAAIVDGGKYHNLKDLATFPLSGSDVTFERWPSIASVRIADSGTLFDLIQKKDILLNVPYQSYDPVLRFFNEAAADPSVTEVYTTLYRVADSSKIVSALITAARNGKKVVAIVELKARFDEANNIKWAKKMKAAGVKVVYTRAELKVHAKVALVKRRVNLRDKLLGLLATGNLNETTARFYTDHVLLTANQLMLQELALLFNFLMKSNKLPDAQHHIAFNHLLVAQFNLQQRFIGLIDREIANVHNGLPAGITIKLNNLEERTLIEKLYQASQAGVQIKLIVRGICCLIPGIKGLSDNISVTRIVDRYLEHGRIFIFENAGEQEVFMGSADWMNRNIYSRIEVCFPVLDQENKNTLTNLITLHFQDKPQHAVYLFLQQNTLL